VLGRLLIRGGNGIAPGVFAEGLDVFGLCQVESLNQGVPEIGEGGRGFRLHLALSHGGEEAAESGTEIAGGEIVAGKVVGDILASSLASEGLRFAARVEGAKVRMGVATRHAALAAVGKSESTQRGTIVGAIGHGDSPEKKNLGFVGESLAEARLHFCTGIVYQNLDYRVNKNFEAAEPGRLPEMMRP
jgi:hypothetical protein